MTPYHKRVTDAPAIRFSSVLSCPTLNGIELRNLCFSRILPKVCSCLNATSIAALWRDAIGVPESKAHSRYTSRLQGNQWFERFQFSGTLGSRSS